MNFGTVGTSRITNGFIEAAEQSGKLTLHAVYSRNRGKGEEFAEKYHAPNVFTELEEMAKSSEIDVVYIASPNSLHFDQVITFLENKKHVICEKPIFSNIKELEKAFETAEENGVFLFEAIRNVHAPNLQILKENLHKAGEISGALLPYIQYSSRYDLFLQGEEPNIFSAAFSGGALVDLGVYPTFLAVSLFGEPTSVTYHPVILRTGIDGGGTLLLQYDDFVCTILCSKTAHSTLPCEIHGEKGTFVLADAAPITKLEYIDNHTKERELLAIEKEEQDMVYEINAFTRIIETRNTEEYEHLKGLSKIVLRITEKARRQNEITFGSEK
jgi:predicted dehydrogenase